MGLTLLFQEGRERSSGQRSSADSKQAVRRRIGPVEPALRVQHHERVRGMSEPEPEQGMEPFRIGGQALVLGAEQDEPVTGAPQHYGQHAGGGEAGDGQGGQDVVRNPLSWREREG